MNKPQEDEPNDKAMELRIKVDAVFQGVCAHFDLPLKLLNVEKTVGAILSSSNLPSNWTEISEYRYPGITQGKGLFEATTNKREKVPCAVLKAVRIIALIEAARDNLKRERHPDATCNCFDLGVLYKDFLQGLLSWVFIGVFLCEPYPLSEKSEQPHLETFNFHLGG